MGVMSSGLGIGYDRGQYTSSHGPPHGMQRQKSIGEAVCLSCLPAPVCLSSGPGEASAVLPCLSVANGVLCVGTFYLYINVCHKLFSEFTCDYEKRDLDVRSQAFVKPSGDVVWRIIFVFAAHRVF